MKKTIQTLILFAFTTILFGQQEVINEKIVTYDGNKYVGQVVDENGTTVTIKTPTGIEIPIPHSSIVERSSFEGKVIGGKIFHPDPNRSMYMFAPSAFPVGSGKVYCRDFCVFFPSINTGIGSNLSGQLGAFWFPGLPVSETPIVGSLKISLQNNQLLQGKARFAAGAMYIRWPGDVGVGSGFTFLTGTIGDEFSHASANVGWGFVKTEEEWDFMDTPLLVLSGNKRVSNAIAFVGEGWFNQDMFELSNSPIIGAIRFFGERFSFDFGALITIDSIDEGLPMPIINFAYYIKK